MSFLDSIRPPLKLTLLAVGAASYYVSHTPPNPAPPKEDRIATGQPFDSLVRQIAWTSKIVVCLGFASEFIVDLVTAYPSVLEASPIVEQVYNALTPVKPDPTSILSIPPTLWFGALNMIGCVGVRVWCFRTLGRFFLYEVAVLRTHNLVTWGPYSIVRHPGYTSAIASVVGVAAMQFSRGSWIRECNIMGTWMKVPAWWFLSFGTMSIISLWRRCQFEDDMLKERFGEDWEKWRKDVPYKLFPGIY